MEAGSNVKGMVESWPLRVVAAWVRWFCVRRGRRNCEDQPRPRMRMSTGFWGGEGGEEVVVVVVGGWVVFVIVGVGGGGAG